MTKDGPVVTLKERHRLDIGHNVIGLTHQCQMECASAFSRVRFNPKDNDVIVETTNEQICVAVNLGKDTGIHVVSGRC